MFLRPAVESCLSAFRKTVRQVKALDRIGLLLEVTLEDYVQRQLIDNPRFRDSQRLNRYERKVFSQTGEDGILEEIFARIGEGKRRFVEFGVESHENNSLYLLLRGWSGGWIEASPKRKRMTEEAVADKIREGSLKVHEAFVTPETIESVFRTMDVDLEVDLLSIDIDGNDFWVWSGLETYRPRVVVVEYNPVFPAHVDWVMKYDPGHRWDLTSHFGASLKALERLGRDKGYTLVACSFAGTNAFFVRTDLVGSHFTGPFTAEFLYEPARYFLAWRMQGHARRYGAGIVR